jgi:alkyl sulfatase BDS1-like metallo-beta-lactamase superfamily hydrolase
VTYEPGDPTAASEWANREAAGRYAMDDRADFHDFDRGLVAPIPDARTVNDSGDVVYDGADYA